MHVILYFLNSKQGQKYTFTHTNIWLNVWMQVDGYQMLLVAIKKLLV